MYHVLANFPKTLYLLSHHLEYAKHTQRHSVQETKRIAWSFCLNIGAHSLIDANLALSRCLVPSDAATRLKVA